MKFQKASYSEFMQLLILIFSILVINVLGLHFVTANELLQTPLNEDLRGISKILCNLTYESSLLNTNKYIDTNIILIKYESLTGIEEKWSNIRTYIDNWNQSCSIFVENTSNFTGCNIVNGSKFFDFAFPLPDIFLGKNLDCKNVGSFGLFFGLEIEDESYYIKGFKLWWIIIILGIIGIIYLVNIFNSPKHHI